MRSEKWIQGIRFDRVPEELWTEVCDIVQEAVFKTIPKKKKSKKLVQGSLTNSYEKKRSKRPRRKGKIYHLNAEFQRIARRDEKAFLGDQCKEIGGKNRMGKTRDLFKKMRDTKGTFRAKMGTIKDRNGMDLIEAEDIKKMWKDTQKNCTKKDLNDPDNHDGVITHLVCEVKCLRKHHYDQS